MATDTAALTVIEPLDLDVDSDNNNGTSLPDRSETEESVEQKTEPNEQKTGQNCFINR